MVYASLHVGCLHLEVKDSVAREGGVGSLDIHFWAPLITTDFLRSTISCFHPVFSYVVDLSLPVTVHQIL